MKNDAILFHYYYYYKFQHILKLIRYNIIFYIMVKYIYIFHYYFSFHKYIAIILINNRIIKKRDVLTTEKYSIN